MITNNASRLIRLKWDIEEESLKIAKNGCWLWTKTRNSNGYGQVKIDKKHWFVHRASYTIFKGDIPCGLCVCHSCDNPSCVNPDHLWLGTRKQNSEDMVRKGRVCRLFRGGGFKKGHLLSKAKRVRKLTDDQVRSIRASTEPLKVLAERFNVSMACVSVVRRKKRKQLIP